MSDSEFGRFLELRRETEERQMEFLKVEMRTGLTFARNALVEVDSGHWEHARHSARNARKAYEEVQHWLPSLPGASAEDRQWFDENMKELADVLEKLPG